MNGDAVEGGAPGRGWSPSKLRFRWSSRLQNLQFEIEAARAQITRVGDLDGLDSHQQGVVQECWKCLETAKNAFHRCFPREFLIWQMLFLIQQYLVLVAPAVELPSKWHLLKQRLKQLSDKAKPDPCEDDYYKEIYNKINNWDSLKEEEQRDFRNRIVQVKKSIDDAVLIDLWKGLQIRRYSVIFLVWAATCIAVLLALITFPEWSAPYVGLEGDGKKHSAAGTVVAGTLGAALSALAPGRSTIADGVPLLTATSWVRPVIGAASGLLLYLVHYSEFAQLDYPGLYVVAIAFGFSERGFYRLLGGIARGFENDLASNMPVHGPAGERRRQDRGKQR